MNNEDMENSILSMTDLVGFSVKELAIVYAAQGRKLANERYAYYDDKYYDDKYYDDKYYDDKYYDDRYAERYSERNWSYGDSDRSYSDSYSNSGC